MALIQLNTHFADFNLFPLEITRRPVYLNDELLHSSNIHFHPVSALSFSDASLCITISSEYLESV